MKTQYKKYSRNQIIIGQKYNKLTVIEKAKTKGTKGYRGWLCRCDCGNIKHVTSTELIYGGVKSCGCLYRVAIASEMIGKKFGKLTFIDECERNKYGQAQCLCKCDCGNETKVALYRLKTGITRSCGCLIGKTSLEKSECGFNRLFADYKYNAKKRNISFVLSKNEFKFLTKQNCNYCNSEPKTYKRIVNKRISIETKEHAAYLYNGIDRINSQIGYTIINCVSCCKKCNYAKSDLKKEDFLNHIKKIYEHNFKK